jgi:hypothetical protein
MPAFLFERRHKVNEKLVDIFQQEGLVISLDSSTQFIEIGSRDTY